MKDFFQNQIAMALMVLMVLGIGAYICLGASAKDIIMQVITAISALVTGTALGRASGQRSTDQTTGGISPQNPV